MNGMKTEVQRLFNLAFVFSCSLVCSCSQTNHAGRCPAPCLEEDKSSVIAPSVSKMLVRCLGFRVDQEGFNSTIRLGQCDDRHQCKWLLDQINKSEFKDRFVPNWNPPYYLIFLTAGNQIVCAVECTDDNFHFVQAKKTFWSYYVGGIIPVHGSKWKHGDPFEWGEIPDFEHTVWRICRRRLIRTHPGGSWIR